MKPIAIKPVTRAESPMDPAPTAATALRGKLEPNRMSKVALAKGSAGMSHKQLITSSPHFTDRVHIKGLEPVIDLQDQRQSYGYFCGCHPQADPSPHRWLGNVDPPVFRIFRFGGCRGDRPPPPPPARAWRPAPRRSCKDQTRRSRLASVQWRPCPDLRMRSAPNRRLRS